VPKTGRSLIGTVAGFKSEWWPVFDRNGGRLHVGICTQGREVCVVFTANGDAPQSEDRIAPLFADLLRLAGADPE